MSKSIRRPIIAAGVLCAVLVASTPAEAFTPVPIPSCLCERVLSKSLTSVLTSGVLRVEFASIGTGHATATDGIEIGGRWHRLGKRRLAVNRAPRRAVRRIVSIPLTERGRALLRGRKRARVRVTISGDDGNRLRTVVTLPK